MRPTGAAPIRFGHLWWLNPCWPLGIMLLGTGISAYVISPPDYIENWKTPKFFDFDSLQYMVFCVAGFLFSAGIVQFVSRRTPPRFGEVVMEDPQIPWPVLWFVFYIGIVLTTLAYVIWLASAFAHGLTPKDILAAVRNAPGAVYVIRDKTETVPGVTTFTQLAMGLTIVGMLLGFKFGWRKNLLAVAAPLGLIFTLAALRAHFREERAAVLEIIIPALVITLALLRTSTWSARARWTLGVLPLGAPLALYVFFSVAEYSRSWVNFYQSHGQSSFFWFTFTRLAGYYVTALNNGAAYSQHMQFPLPYFTLEWFWKFPLIKDIFPYTTMTGLDPAADYNDFLQEKLNPELNNISGLFPLEVDFGYLGGIVAWSFLGVIAMVLYRSFLKGNFLGLLMYPFFYIGLLESPRILYWTDSRTLPTWFLLFAILLIGLLVRQGDWHKLRRRSGWSSARGKRVGQAGLSRQRPQVG